MAEPESQLLSENVWEDLVGLIRDRKVTPIIGAGACAGILPDSKSLARRWAEEHGYPLADSADLSRVAQYLAIKRYGLYPKQQVAKLLRDAVKRPAVEASSVHRILAELDLPIYITTNYDDLMSEALKARHVDHVREFPRWNDFAEVVSGRPPSDSPRKSAGKTPKTVVYHLHGHWDEVQSMVLTEDDYLDFMVRLTKKDVPLISAPIRKALAGTSLLFVGYSMADWNFRVLLRGLIGALEANLRYVSVAVQLPPDGLTDEQRRNAQDYLSSYFSKIQRLDFKVYWGDVRQFTSELSRRVSGETQAQS